MSKKKCSTPSGPNSRGQLLQALNRRAKIKRRRPAGDLLSGGPDLNQKPIPLPRLGMDGDSFPITFETAPRGKRLKTEATDGKRCYASFTEDVCRFCIGEIVILNEEGMTIHIPADPNKGIRRRRAPRKQVASVSLRVEGGTRLRAFKNHRCFYRPCRNHRLLHVINHGRRVMDHRLKNGFCTAFQPAHPAAVAFLADAPSFEVFSAIGHRRVAAKRLFDFGRPTLRHGLNYPLRPKVFPVELFPATEDALSHAD